MVDTTVEARMVEARMEEDLMAAGPTEEDRTEG